LPDLTRGKLLRAYDFKGIGGLKVEPGTQELHVIDASSDDVTPRRYLLRRFERDGRFLAAVRLSVEDEKEPDAVDGYVFGAFGAPFYTYREAERFVLRRLYTATPRDAVQFPGHAIERAGLAALGADGAVITLAALRLDPEEKTARTTRSRRISYTRAEPDRDPIAIFGLDDPFAPTVRMAMGPEGRLWLFGNTPDGRLGVKLLEANQALTDLPVALPKHPDRVAFDAKGRCWMAFGTTGDVPASVEVRAPGGELLGRQAVTLADGAKVFEIEGLAFDAVGTPLIAGRAIDRNLVVQRGIFEFAPQP
jgi:hypothetical protein